MVIYARYTFNLDDIWMWLDIYNSRPIFNGYNPSAGRFFPLASLDLNILMQFSKSPYLFFGFNAFVVWLVGLAIWIVLQMILGQYVLWLRIVVLGIILFHPGFVTIMVGICYPERLQILFLCLFVLVNFAFLHRATFATALIGFISANLAMYYKEPTFLMIGLFGCFMLITSLYRHQSKMIVVYYASLVVSACVYICIYLLLIYPKITKIYHRETFENAREEWLIVLKGLFNFVIDDVFLFVLLPSLVIYRVYLIMRKKSKIDPFYDSFLICAMFYLATFLKLKLFENYYLMPIYIIGFGTTIYFLFVKNYIKLIFFKIINIICVVVFMINTLPIGLNIFVYLKSEGVKFHSALNFINKEAQTKTELVLYFDGNGENRKIHSSWYWNYFEEYLRELYDVHNVVLLFDENKLKSGDYVLINSSMNKMVDSAYLASMNERYNLVYKSSAFGLPYIGLKPFIKATLGKNNKAIKEATYNNTNIFRLPVHDYIYKVP